MCGGGGGTTSGSGYYPRMGLGTSYGGYGGLGGYGGGYGANSLAQLNTGRSTAPAGYYPQDATALANASPPGTVKAGTGFGAGAMSGGNMLNDPTLGGGANAGAPGSTFYGKTGPLGTAWGGNAPSLPGSMFYGKGGMPLATTGGNMATGLFGPATGGGWNAAYGGAMRQPLGNPWGSGGIPQWTVPPGGGPQPTPTPPPGYTPPTTQPPVTQPPIGTGGGGTAAPNFGGLSQQQQYLLAKQMGWNSPLNQQLLQQAGGESAYNALMNQYNANGVGAGQDAAYAQQLAMALNPNLPQATRNYNAGLLTGTPWANYLGR